MGPHLGRAGREGGPRRRISQSDERGLFMRKLLIIATAALLAVPAAASSAAPETRRAGADVIRMAFASFLHHPRDGGAPTLYFGAGLGFNLGDDHAFAGRGPCHRKEHRGRRFWSCSASARGVRVLPTGFYMDPLLQRAHIELERGGFRHAMDWIGKGDPSLGFGGGSRTALVAATNNARAAGRLFGHRFPAKHARSWSFLAELAFVHVQTDTTDIRLGRDGRLHVTVLMPAAGR